MKIFKMRYAVVGWLAVKAGKLYARRKARRLAHR